MKYQGCEIKKSDAKDKKTRASIREQIVRELAGWLSHAEAQELRKAVEIFNKVERQS